MWETIDRLRQKPKATRNQVAFLVALLVALVTAGAWSLTLPSRVTSMLPQSTSTVAAVSDAPSVWSSVVSLPASVRQLFVLPTGTTVDEKESPEIDEAPQTAGVWAMQATGTSAVRPSETTSQPRAVLIATSTTLITSTTTNVATTTD